MNIKKLKIESVINFLEEEGIELSQDFEEEFEKNIRRHDSSIPSKRSIKAVILTCEKWRGFVENQTEFNKLVCNEVYSMARIQCSVLSSDKDSKTFIGKKCKLNEYNLPKMTTIATYEGKAFIRKGIKNLRELD